MVNSWEVVPLEALVDSDRGISYGIVQPGLPVPDGVPIIRVGDIRNGRIAITDPLRVASNIEAAHARTRLNGGELLLTIVGTIGETAIVPDSLKGWNTARAVAVIPVVQEVGSRWVQFALKSKPVREIIDSRLNTTVQATLNLRDVAQLPIVLPPRRDRKAIIHILGTLDDKIELMRRMNETLEAMARALFKSWFIDFDPVRAKAEGRDPCMPKNIAEVLPASFECSKQGELPGGWQATTLARYAKLNPEVWTRDTRPLIVNYVDLSNTKWGRLEEIVEYRQTDAPSRAQRILRPGDTIVGTVRPGNGSYALIHQDGLTGSTGFAVLRPLKDTYAEFTYLSATASDNIDRLAHLADGAAYPAVRPEVVAATQTVEVPERVLEVFSEFVGPMLGKIAASEDESRTLSALRDTLLPKLISGEIRVKDAEKMAEAVA